MGLPDIPSPELEAEGGAWWGRALLRGGIPGPHSQSGMYGIDLPFLGYGGLPGAVWGAPLVIQPEDEDLPAFRVFCRAFIRSGALHLSVLHGRQVHNVVRPLSLQEIGQGAGQPEVAAYGVTPQGVFTPFRITDAYQGRFSAFVRDFSRNRLLLGIVAMADLGAPSAQPPLSSVSTDSAGAWADSIFPLMGLVEVEVLPSMFVEGAAPENAIVVRLLEDRRSAIGQPVFDTEDIALPVWGRQYFARWTQTSGLLNAFYGADGAVQTIRYSRTQEVTLHRRQIEAEAGSFYRQQDMTRETTLQILGVGGQRDDEFILFESLTEIERGPKLQVIRTVSATGEDDDVQDSGEVVAAAIWAEPLDVYMPGFHMFAPCIAQLYRAGGVDLIEPQDIRVAWIVAYGNRMGCLAFTREPYTTTAGNPITVRMRKIATPRGLIDDELVSVELKPTGFLNVRSLFLFPAFLNGAYNPVTGGYARARRGPRSMWI